MRQQFSVEALGLLVSIYLRIKDFDSIFELFVEIDARMHPPILRRLD